MLNRKIIAKYIHENKLSATEEEKRSWSLLQMWNDTRSVETFEAMVRTALKDSETELQKGPDPIWQEVDERYARVYRDIVNWMDQQRKGVSD